MGKLIITKYFQQDYLSLNGPSGFIKETGDNKAQIHQNLGTLIEQGILTEETIINSWIAVGLAIEALPKDLNALEALPKSESSKLVNFATQRELYHYMYSDSAKPPVNLQLTDIYNNYLVNKLDALKAIYQDSADNQKLAEKTTEIQYSKYLWQKSKELKPESDGEITDEQLVDAQVLYWLHLGFQLEKSHTALNALAASFKFDKDVQGNFHYFKILPAHMDQNYQIVTETYLKNRDYNKD